MSDEHDYCADQVKRFDYDRWLTALFAPADDRRGLMALYALNLELAKSWEAVSEPLLGEIRLQWWREAVDGAFAGTPRTEPVTQALAAAIAVHGLSRTLFDRLIDARARDLYLQVPESIEALETYVAETAGTLTELAVECLGATSDASRQAARDVGIGWALVGLIRAVPFHATHRRVHLPEDLLAGAGSSVEGVLAEPTQPALRPVLAWLGSTAAVHFAAARKLRRAVDKAALPALLPATLGQLYLRRLKRAGWDPADPRIVPPGPVKQLQLFSRALLKRY